MIPLKSTQEISVISEAGQIVSEVLKEIKKKIKPGVTTLELDREAEAFIQKAGAKPAFKDYRGYPYTICASVNEEVVHGMPSLRTIREGDIVSIDIGVFYKGFYSDIAFTFAIGEVAERSRELLKVAKEALYQGIKQAFPNNSLGAISAAIQSRVEEAGFSVVREYVGHGIGRAMHEEPQIPNWGKSTQGPCLKPGMVLAIEAMVNLGGFKTVLLPNNWTAVTQDGMPSAHFEHTVAILESGWKILTRFPEED